MTAAELTAATFDPVPVVAINGVDVASGASSAAATLVAVDGLAVSWGREADEVLDQPDPATGSLTLFDTTGTWATSADRRGLPITLRYTGVAPGGATVSSVFFRGRIGSPVQISRRDVWRRVDGKRVRGVLVSLPLQSALVDLANITPRGAYPLETLGARFDRLVAAAQAAGHLTGGGVIRDYWRTPNVAAIAAKDQRPILDQLVELFDSAGADSYTYRPATDSINNVERRELAVDTFARLWWDGTDPLLARGGEGAYIRAANLNAATGTVDPGSGDGLYLDAASLEYDPEDGLVSQPRITRVALTHKSDQDSFNDRTVELPVRREAWDPLGGNTPLDEKDLGVRTAKVDSAVVWTQYADIAASDTEQLIRREGSRWQLRPLRISTRRLGGFETVAQAQCLLAGYERRQLVFLQRSFLPELGIRPVFGIKGATIRYAGGGWDVEFALIPAVSARLQHVLTFEDLNTGNPALDVLCWDEPHPQGFHPSLTFEDLRYVGTTLAGVTPTPTDKDEYQQ